MNDRYFGKVAAIVDPYEMVMNRGEEHGSEVGQRYRVIRLGEEIKDPDTGESLGPLERFQGIVEVLHVEAKKSSLRSVEYEREPDQTVSGSSVPMNRLIAIAMGSALPGGTVTTEGKLLRKPVPARVGDFLILDESR